MSITDRDNAKDALHSAEILNKEVEEMYALAVNPDDFLRASGELFARYDSAWKSAKNSHLPLERHIADFLSTALVHLDALELCSLYREALMAMVSILITIDMSKVSVASLGESFVNLHERFLTGCIRLHRECDNDGYAKPHAQAILSHEAAMFARLTDRLENLSTRQLGLAEGCRRFLEEHPEETADIDSPAEALIDIFARLHAIES